MSNDMCQIKPTNSQFCPIRLGNLQQIHKCRRASSGRMFVQTEGYPYISSACFRLHAQGFVLKDLVFACQCYDQHMAHAINTDVYQDKQADKSLQMDTFTDLKEDV